jgi:ABC-type proline/glycine betaine transport system permease subunit
LRHHGEGWSRGQPGGVKKNIPIDRFFEHFARDLMLASRARIIAVMLGAALAIRLFRQQSCRDLYCATCADM